jgi:DNA-binding LacI/PurR family transcriptional regulator
MQKRVTAREVAEAAGVSRTTVSFVLNDVPGMRISAETRQRVLQVAKQLGYQPNISAQRLVTGQTRILAYVERQTPERAFADAFLPQVLRGVHDAASASDYEVLFAPIPLENGATRCTRLLRGGHVDGLILSGPRSDDLELRQLLEGDAPLVLQGHWPGISVASVDVDNIAAAKMATEHLIHLGHKNIGMIVHAPLAYTAAAARMQGYQEAVKAAELHDSTACIVLADFTPASGEAAMEELLECEAVPTAIFAGSDTVAIGAMRAVKRKGYRIPQDIAFIGFDDIPMAVYHDPPLTSVRLPAYGIGWAAADLLIRLIGRDDVRDRNILLKSELTIRASCGALLEESTDR